MRRIITIILVFSLCGCSSLPFVKDPDGKLAISEGEKIGLVKRSVNAKSGRVWDVAVEELRRFSVLESNKSEGFIKAVNDDVFIEFEIKSSEQGECKFNVEAYSADGSSRRGIAEKISLRIYKRAKPGWLF